MREAVAVGAAGAALAGAVATPLGLTIPAAVVGGLNGAISGHRRIYEWGAARGVVAFVLDSTWGLLGTAAGVFAHAAGRVRGDPGYVPELSERQNRHVYRRGFQPRRGFATTLGNVVNGAGDIAHPRRAKLVTDHEDVHVWQSRHFGPFFPALYLGWSAGGAVAGAVVWAVRRRDQPFGRVVETYAYYLNPFEWWAYSRDEHWPPRRKLPGTGWRQPAVRSFASIRRERDARRVAV